MLLSESKFFKLKPFEDFLLLERSKQVVQRRCSSITTRGNYRDICNTNRNCSKFWMAASTDKIRAILTQKSGLPKVVFMELKIILITQELDIQ
jgi:hypothetical protein